MAYVVPEPPDGSRIEFTRDTDVYAAWRSDAASAAAGWSSGDGGEVWCLYGECVPHTWGWMISVFGADTLRNAVYLVPVYPDPETTDAVRLQTPIEFDASRQASRRPHRRAALNLIELDLLPAGTEVEAGAFDDARHGRGERVVWRRTPEGRWDTGHGVYTAGFPGASSLWLVSHRGPVTRSKIAATDRPGKDPR